MYSLKTPFKKRRGRPYVRALLSEADDESNTVCTGDKGLVTLFPMKPVFCGDQSAQVFSSRKQCQGGQHNALDRRCVPLPAGCEESVELRGNSVWCGGTKHTGISNTVSTRNSAKESSRRGNSGSLRRKDVACSLGDMDKRMLAVTGRL